MTAFVETSVETRGGSAEAVARRTRGQNRAVHLLGALAGKRNILITTHEHPDPDALASSLALCRLLERKLPEARMQVSVRGEIGGGVNEIFVQQMGLGARAWDEAALGDFDAIILVDTQPPFTNNPLPEGMLPTAVIDHHRSRGRRYKIPFTDIRSDVGATATIIFSYYLELEVPISRDLAATLLFAIESDLAGAAGHPGALDSMALSSLMLVADTRKLYKMRYVDLPQNYFIAYADGMRNARLYEMALMSHLERVDSPEIPAVIADFLLRYDQAKWALITAVRGERLVISLRTYSGQDSAADIMRRLIDDIGEGGGHRTKAGGEIPLANGGPAELKRLRATLRRRYLRALEISTTRGQRLLPAGK